MHRDPLTASPGFLAAHSRARAAGGSGARILLADDNVMNQTVVVSMLSKLGYHADVVSNGREAVDAFSRIPYDLVFMDCHMPVMNGFEATTEIRRLEARAKGSPAASSTPSPWPLAARHIPIIALTASVMTADRHKCLAAGMDEFLPKPLSMKALAGLLERWKPGAARAEAGAPLDHPTPHPSRLSPALDEVCDINTALVRLDGNEELLLQLVDMFRSLGPSLADQIGEAVSREDGQACAEHAHRLKGTVTLFAAPRLYETVKGVEEAGKSGDVPAVHALLPVVQRELSELLEVLERWAHDRRASHPKQAKPYPD